MIEPVEFRREFARQWCDQVYAPEEFFDAPPRAVDVVIESSGQMDNVNRVFRRLNANGRVALLARSGTGLTLDAVDDMITNAITVTGSRGHLGGAFATVLSLYQGGRIPLDKIVTEVVDGVDGLCTMLRSPARIQLNNCKVLARIRKGAPPSSQL